jgi:hypothetical protein
MKAIQIMKYGEKLKSIYQWDQKPLLKPKDILVEVKQLR